MNRTVLFSFLFALFMVTAQAQPIATGFKTNCDCTFELESDKPAPGGYPLKSYRCTANSMGEAVLYRVMIMDLGKDMNRLPGDQARTYAESYYSALVGEMRKANIRVTEKRYQGHNAMEYSQFAKFEGETLPQRTMVFIADNRSVTLQLISSSAQFDQQFEEFKRGFVLLK